MSKLPRLSGRDCVKALAKVGFYQKRQHGSHIILRRDNPFAQVVVPDGTRSGYIARDPAARQSQRGRVQRGFVEAPAGDGLVYSDA